MSPAVKPTNEVNDFVKRGCEVKSLLYAAQAIWLDLPLTVRVFSPNANVGDAEKGS